MNTTVGIDRYFGKFAWAEVAYFYHDIKNWITKNSPDRTAPYLNVGVVKMEGFELNSEFYLPVKDLVLTFDYLYDYARNPHHPDVLYNGTLYETSDKIPYVPLHKFDAGLKYIVPRIGTKLNFDAVYVAQSYNQVATVDRPTNAQISNGSQMTFDCRISQKFLNYFEAYMAMDNMLDKNYMPEYGFPAPGRTFWFGLTAKY